MRIKQNSLTPQVNEIYRRAETAMLWERIHHTRRDLLINDRSLLGLHLELSRLLRRNDCGLVDGLKHCSFESVYVSTADRHRAKFEPCHPVNNSVIRKDSGSNRKVFNISNRQLTETEVAVN